MTGKQRAGPVQEPSGTQRDGSPGDDRPESNVVLVDGSNVAHSTEGDKPLIANLIAVRD